MSFVLLVLISFVSGCGHQCQLIRHSYTTNYEIGEIYTALKGQNIAKLKDYYVCKGYETTVIKYENFLCDSFINYSGNTCGYINYELIYAGMNNVSMNITYKEYSRNDYARPLFYQNLTFEPKAKQIRFKDFVIEILEANIDYIKYKILSDGLKQTEFNNGENPDFERIKHSR
jgi:hypothetical protein